MKKMYFDVETTGLDPKKHSMHQLAALIEIDGEVIDKLDYRIRPHHLAQLDPYALEIGGVTKEQVLAYPPMGEVFEDLILRLTEYVDRYNKTDKFHLVGYNNRKFDDVFLRAWFKQNGDGFFGSWFHSDSLDVMVLASQYLLERRAYMTNFKLGAVANELQIFVENDKLHDALYDVEITRAIYQKVCYEKT